MPNAKTASKTTAEIKSIDPVWEAVRAGARQIVDAEPSLANLAISAVLNHDTFEQALAHRLAALLPQGEAYVIPKRDHMRATGDKAFRAAGLAFLGRTFPLQPHS